MRLKGFNIVLLGILLLCVSGSCFANAISSFTIEGAKLYSNTANVTLYISAEDANVMSFSCNGSSWSDYIAYAVTTSFDLNSGSYGCTPNEGTRTAYAKVQYLDGNYSNGSNSDSIILDFNAPQVTSFSPATDISNGNGANGQAISIGVSDDYNLANVSITLTRGTATVYSGSLTKCSVTGTSATCAFTDSSVNRGGSYTYAYVVSDQAGNTKSATSSFAFTDSIAPSKPTNLQGSDVNTTVSLNWDRNIENDFNKFAVYRSTSSGFEANSSTFLSYSDSNSYTDLGLDENTTYYYKVKSIDLTGNFSEASDQNYFTSDYNTLTVPIVTRSDKPCISGSWCPSASAVLSISGVSSAKYSWILTTSSTTLPSDCNFYSDCNALIAVALSGLAEGTTYFKIKACKPNGCSPTTVFTIKTDLTPPSAPSNVTVTSNDNNYTVSWSAATDSLSGIWQYYVYRSTNPGFTASDFYLLYIVPSTTFSYSDLTAKKGTSYYYKVLARDYAGNYGADANSQAVQSGTTQIATDANIAIQTKNSSNEDINYFNKPVDLNLLITFSKQVSHVNVYKTINGTTRQSIALDQNNISSYLATLTTSASYSSMRIDVNAFTGSGYVSAYKILYFDDTAPQVAFKNITSGQALSQDSNINLDVNDNYSIKKVEIYLGREKIGQAVKKDSNSKSSLWVFKIPISASTGAKKLKAIAFDGADNSASNEIEVIINDKNNPVPDNATTANSAEAKAGVASTEAKINELQAYLNEKQIILNPNQANVKAEADALLQEARSLADTNSTLSKQKSTEAFNRYAAILTQVTNEYLAKHPASSGISFELIGGIVLVLVIIAAGIFLFLRGKMNPPEKEYPLPMNIDKMIAQIK